MKSKAIILLAVFCFIVGGSFGVVIQDLGGNDWITYNTNKSIRVSSHVPGSIYTDLKQAGVLEGHIYDDFNDVNYRWVSYDNWTFEKHFDVSENVLKQDNVYLTAHGLDTIGNVTLNGQVLGSVENMFVRYKWPVKKLLKAKQNLIQVSFESAPLYAKMVHEQALKANYPIPPLCPERVTKNQHGECHVNLIRKMQASFSWDWGPAFPTQGIWRPITLEAFNSLFLRTISVTTIPRAGTNLWTLNTTVWLENVKASQTSASLSLNLNRVLLTEKNFTVHFDENGEAFVNVIVDVPDKFNIKPWFPSGVGEAVLYDFKVTITNEHESVSKSHKIGFRTIELSQEQLFPPKAGHNIINAFYFKVNNVTLYSKGSNWIPAHMLYEAITEDYLYDLLLAAKLSNQNIIRVWGGGFYEIDRFYEIADELGLLVYQDMMFASALYPADDHFMANVATEIRQQVRRLQYHPSIFIWSGNNEDEFVIARPYWPGTRDHWDQYKKDYIRLTINVTMEIILNEDTSRPFVSSCPSSGVADKRKGYLALADKRAGDMHFYIGSGDAFNWRRYPSAKFVSEYGFQSLSSLNVLEKYISKEHLKYPLTTALKHRQHLQDSDSLFRMMKEQFHLPKHGSVRELSDFIYLNQLFQAMAMKIESEFYRRNRKLADNGDGFTMGALYWQLNEAWPSFSWSSLEFGGKWKMLHYYVRNFFDNYLVDIFEDDHEILKVVIVRDDHYEEKAKFSVNINVFDWSSPNSIHNEKLEASTEPFSVNSVFEQNITSFLEKAKCSDRNRCFIQVNISGQVNGESIERKNFLLLGRVKNAIGMRPAHVRVVQVAELARDDKLGFNRFTVDLQTDQIAPFVWVDITPESEVEGIFSDNGFILTNKTSLTFQTRANISKTQLHNLITVRSLSDVHFE